MNPSRLVRNASEVPIGTPPPSVELGAPGWRFYLWQTRKRDRRLGRTSSMTYTLAPDPCSQNRAVKAPASARAVTAAQFNTGHHLSKRVPFHPVWPRADSCTLLWTNPRGATPTGFRTTWRSDIWIFLAHDRPTIESLM